MLERYNYEDYRVCSLDCARNYASLAQRRYAPWVIQVDHVPVRGNKPLCRDWPGFVRVWRLSRFSGSFVGFTALSVDAFSRLICELGVDYRKQHIVADNFFCTRVLPDGENRVNCNMLFGKLSIIHLDEGRLDTFVPGTVFTLARCLDCYMALPFHTTDCSLVDYESNQSPRSSDERMEVDERCIQWNQE